MKLFKVYHNSSEWFPKSLSVNSANWLSNEAQQEKHDGCNIFPWKSIKNILCKKVSYLLLFEGWADAFVYFFHHVSPVRGCQWAVCNVQLFQARACVFSPFSFGTLFVLQMALLLLFGISSSCLVMTMYIAYTVGYIPESKPLPGTCYLRDNLFNFPSVPISHFIMVFPLKMSFFIYQINFWVSMYFFFKTIMLKHRIGL